jgi:hypothetical protein
MSRNVPDEEKLQMKAHERNKILIYSVNERRYYYREKWLTHMNTDYFRNVFFRATRKDMKTHEDHQMA